MRELDTKNCLVKRCGRKCVQIIERAHALSTRKVYVSESTARNRPSVSNSDSVLVLSPAPLRPFTFQFQ